MEELTVRICLDDDLDLLAALNKQLIEDEKHDNKMDLDQLKERMRGFIHTTYTAYLFEQNGDVKGYALVDHVREPLYLRHFFICRHCRRGGYGKAAFQLLTKQLNTSIIDIEVTDWNEAGRRFWASLGFKERSVYMRLEGNHHNKGATHHGA
ncbi:GNAT family N-acetyltransferase [Paenibacillus harenae]|nr:GNAT family N-acetyltransferase [Paenibacillus harenae]MDQ0060094.1 GNAT superfamily N-acetyltransferase [Paenibacillus harenae]